MSLTASCPRCTAAIRWTDGRVLCSEHGEVPAFWRPSTPDYAAFVEVVRRAGELPAYLPWPLSPGWLVTGVGVVSERDRPVATVLSAAGASALDGDVRLTVVAEEPGVGLGARCAHTSYDDPGPQIAGPPATWVRVDGHRVPLWHLAQPDRPHEEALQRSVLVGEAEGRWLWLVVEPGSAALLVREDLRLADATAFGPQAVELPFGGTASQW